MTWCTYDGAWCICRPSAPLYLESTCNNKMIFSLFSSTLPHSTHSVLFRSVQFNRNWIKNKFVDGEDEMRSASKQPNEKKKKEKRNRFLEICRNSFRKEVKKISRNWSNWWRNCKCYFIGNGIKLSILMPPPPSSYQPLKTARGDRMKIDTHLNARFSKFQTTSNPEYFFFFLFSSSLFLSRHEAENVFFFYRHF